MKISEFKRIKEFEDPSDATGEIDDIFMAGENMISQKVKKSIGQEITYYKIINKDKFGNIMYIPIYDKLIK